MNESKTEILAIREAADYILDPQIMELKIQARANPSDWESMIYELFPGTCKIEGDVAWMSVKGPLTGEDYDNIMESLSQLESAPVSKLILDITSPGGSVSGCGETAEAISKFSKPVYALASGMCCSAAYWIASQADNIFASESCSIGSIGVIATHMSLKGAYENMGVKITEVAKGDRKNLFSPNKDLSETGKNELQAQVDLFFESFASAVKSGRRNLKDEVFSSGVFYGKDAIDAGLVDRTVNNKSAMSILFKNKEAPPGNKAESAEEKSISGTEIKQAIEAVQKEILSSVDNSLDERFKTLQPMLDDYNERKAKEQESKAEQDAIEKINASRKARGLKPFIAEEHDDMDDDKDRNPKKEAPGKHGGDYKDDKKDAKIAALEDKIEGLCKVIEKGGLAIHDPIAVDVNGESNQVKLASSGRSIPVTKSWEWVYAKAPDIRSWLQDVGTRAELNEFDSVVVSKVKQDLKKAGVTEPRNIFGLMKGA